MPRSWETRAETTCFSRPRAVFPNQVCRMPSEPNFRVENPWAGTTFFTCLYTNTSIWALRTAKPRSLRKQTTLAVVTGLPSTQGRLCLLLTTCQESPLPSHKVPQSWTPPQPQPVLLQSYQPGPLVDKPPSPDRRVSFLLLKPRGQTSSWAKPALRPA